MRRRWREQRVVFDACLRTRGPEARLALRTRNNIVVSLTRLGRLDEAVAECREGMAASGAVLGPEHPNARTVR